MDTNICNTMTRYQFSIILLKDEVVGYVDRAFAILYDENLQNQWSLTNVDDNTHVVIYNKNLEKPLLIEGWYDLTRKCEPLSIGRFYNRIVTVEPLSRSPKMHFTIGLTPLQVRASHLICIFGTSTFKVGINDYICLLYTSGPKSILILGLNSGKIDLSANGWGIKVEIQGEEYVVFTEEGSKKVQWQQV
ncbi:Glycoside hydrolase [Vigna unguiculata]|uniref:Glycoside hydrolase n=1 Tax=Vigna unguiculata TaxID=3917 RepID=A0A4D6M089_VIGUN|nr:Glycoside hydrolase [Vigna unguiculata]